MLKFRKAVNQAGFDIVQTHYRPLRLNVGFLLSQSAGYGREFDFHEEDITIGGDLSLNTFSGRLLLNRTPQGIVAQGDFTAMMPAECARCLKDFITPIPIQLEELFVYPPQNATDALLAIGEDAHLDLEPILREFLIVNLPTRPLCREDCKGLCPICGNDLNEATCHHPEEEERKYLLPQEALPQDSAPQAAAGKTAKKPAAAKASSAAGKSAAKPKAAKAASAAGKSAAKPKTAKAASAAKKPAKARKPAKKTTAARKKPAAKPKKKSPAKGKKGAVRKK